MLSRALFIVLLLALPAFAGKHIFFLVGDSEYQTGETVPAWARAELEPLGIRCTYLIDDPAKPFNFPQLADLKNADALFISIKRRGIPFDQLAEIAKLISEKKPVIGIRTASHAFDPKTRVGEELSWPKFDIEVFGGHYDNHYGKGPATIASVAPKAAAHPILKDTLFQATRFTSHLYKCRDLAPSTTVLLRGIVEGKPDTQEPLAWLNLSDDRKSFYTSLGSPEDFTVPEFRRFLLNTTLWMLGK